MSTTQSGSTALSTASATPCARCSTRSGSRSSPTGHPTPPLRRNRIDRLLAMVLDNTEDFVDATATDYGSRSRSAALFAEILGMISVIEHTRAHVAAWMRPTG